MAPDPDAVYEKTVEINAAKLDPQIACPHTVDNIKTVKEVAGIKIDQIVIGSCTNGRLDDLAAAAQILKGKKVARGTRMLVFPASWRIYREALKRGYLAISPMPARWSAIPVAVPVWECIKARLVTKKSRWQPPIAISKGGWAIRTRKSTFARRRLPRPAQSPV